ncbi:hypothetical protein ACFLRC_00965 [Candidatus Altiarchaeota archaeon]
MPGEKRFSNQTPDQIIKHLSNLLSTDTSYSLRVDPLGVYFEIKESRGGRKKKKLSDKRAKIKSEQGKMSPRQRKLSNTKKRINPKIRSVKKGRTVTLKGRTY